MMSMTLAPESVAVEDLVEFTAGSPPLPLYGVLHRPADELPEGCAGAGAARTPRSGECTPGAFGTHSLAGCGAVLLAGWSGTRVGPHGILVAMARELASAGCAAIRFDYRGRGDSGGSQSAAHIGTMVEDARQAARFLQQQSGVEKVFLVGICAGAMVAMGAAPGIPGLAGMALWSPPPFHPDESPADRTGEDAGPGKPADTAPARTRSSRRAKLFRQYWNKLFDPRTWEKLRHGQLQPRLILQVLSGKPSRPVNPSAKAEDWAGSKPDEGEYERALPSLRVPALFVYGANDPEREEAVQYYTRLRQEHAAMTGFHVVEGANHSFYSLEWKNEVISTTLDWMAARCIGSSM